MDRERDRRGGRVCADRQCGCRSTVAGGRQRGFAGDAPANLVLVLGCRADSELGSPGQNPNYRRSVRDGDHGQQSRRLGTGVSLDLHRRADGSTLHRSDAAASGEPDGHACPDAGRGWNADRSCADRRRTSRVAVAACFPPILRGGHSQRASSPGGGSPPVGRRQHIVSPKRGQAGFLK